MSAAGRVICVAGQIGWDAATQEFTTDSFSGQLKYALRNTVAVLKAGGASADHIVRMTWYVTDKKEYQNQLKEVGQAYRDEIGRVFPAMALFEVSGLLEPRAKIEIETTAIVPDDA
ncbi:MAG: RidA family protein [Sinobacteraceae bacterium]|nr:RidA family protein [Nevskiaceae bacterium]